MGVKERQEREREEVRQKILDAATELFVAEGYGHVSIRKIADRIEYSPAALYSYFPSKDDLFFALAEKGFRQLFEFTNREPFGESLEDVREGFLRYYEFSRLNPEYFYLMFVDRTVPRIGRDWERFSFVTQMISEVCGMLKRAVDAGVFPPLTDPETAFHILWAAVHGPAVAALCQRLAPDEDPAALARDTLEAALTGLQSGIKTTFKPSPCHEPSADAAANWGNENATS